MSYDTCMSMHLWTKGENRHHSTRQGSTNIASATARILPNKDEELPDTIDDVDGCFEDRLA